MGAVHSNKKNSARKEIVARWYYSRRSGKDRATLHISEVLHPEEYGVSLDEFIRRCESGTQGAVFRVFSARPQRYFEPLFSHSVCNRLERMMLHSVTETSLLRLLFKLLEKSYVSLNYLEISTLVVGVSSFDSTH